MAGTCPGQARKDRGSKNKEIARLAYYNAITNGSADYLDGLTGFNIGGNKYRLIAAIHYNRHKVFIRSVLTHAEYDRGDWKRRK